MALPIMIEVKSSLKLKTKEALFISFQYDLDTLAKVKSLPTRYYNGDGKEWEVPIRDVDKVVTLFQDREVVIRGKVKTKLMEKMQVSKFDKIVVSPDQFEFKTKPFQHQIEGFQYALEHEKFLLGDEQGLGKTKQGIDVAVARKGQYRHALIVCGVNGLKYNWLNEIKIHSNEKGHILGSHIALKGPRKGVGIVEGSVQEAMDDLEKAKKGHLSQYFLITNIEALRNEKFAAKLKELTDAGIIGMSMVDEIHKAKNAQSQQGKALHNIRTYYKMAMTGTPLMNSPLDLYNILKWLDVIKVSFYKFRERYCVMGGYGGYEVVAYKNMEELRELVEKTMLRRKKSETLDLPEKLPAVEYVQMSLKQREIYREVRAAIMDRIDEIVLNPNPLAQLIRLRQATGWTGILSSQVKESAKMERMAELVEELAANGQKAIIYSNWEEMTKVAREKLKEYKPAYVVGNVQAAPEVERFQNDPDCKVIIGTLSKLGTGFTLTAAQTVIFLDSPWNKANKEQAEDRAHRIGTTGTVNIITLVTQGTIDERIEDIVEEKGDMAEALVDGKMDKLAKRNLIMELLS